MSGTSSSQNGTGEKAKVTQAILMHDMNQPHNATLVAQDEDSDSEYEKLFDGVLEKGWTDVRYSATLPKEDHVKKAKSLEDEGRMKKNIYGKLHYEVNKTATLAAQVSGVLVRAGVNIAAENISYYMTRETADHLLSKIPTSSAVATGLKDTFNKVRQEFTTPKQPQNKAAQLASTWSYPPNPRIKDPRDAPEGSNLDDIALIPYEGGVDNVAHLRSNDSDGGEMEDVPFDDDEEDEDDGDEEWEDAWEEAQ